MYSDHSCVSYMQKKYLQNEESELTRRLMM